MVQLQSTSASVRPATDSAFAHAHEALRRHSDYQFDFPSFHRPQPPEWLAALGRFLVQNWPAIKWAIWIIAAALILWAVYKLARKYGPLLPELLKRPLKLPSRPPPEQWRPAPAAARQLLKEADALAAMGRYSDAAHLLLLRSIEDIESRRPNLVRPNFTSREIGRLGALPELARNTFMSIAEVVERALFAGQPVGADVFAQCRQAYERFAFPDVWNAPA